MEPLVMGDISTLPRVSLDDIGSASLAAKTSLYEQAVETLAVSIAKYNCAVIQVSDKLAVRQHTLWQVLHGPRSSRRASLGGVAHNHLVSVAYDPKLRRDTLSARIAGSNAIEDNAATQELSESYTPVGVGGCHHDRVVYMCPWGCVLYRPSRSNYGIQPHTAILPIG